MVKVSKVMNLCRHLIKMLLVVAVIITIIIYVLAKTLAIKGKQPPNHVPKEFG